MRRLRYDLRPSLGMGLLGLLFIMGFALVCPSQEKSLAQPKARAQPYTDSDAYAIYGNLLGRSKNSTLAIKAETDSLPSASPKNMGIEGDQTFYMVWGTALNDYARKYRIPRLLTRSIPMEAHYELISKEEMATIFDSAAQSNPWRRFSELYPESDGMYSFSPVGFDPQRTHAIVSMSHHCGMLCGDGRPHFFEKIEGRWHEVTVNAIVTMWAS
jgi:hypothetical protein